jgi:GNAT superfamily N-acetyltransferase
MPETNISIERVGFDQHERITQLVEKLLVELEGNSAEFEGIDQKKVISDWSRNQERVHAFFAKTEAGEIVGISTLVETFAIYAGGCYGVIDEMYVAPGFRSAGVGKMLIDAVKEFGRKQNWLRIDVTAPPEEQWTRTVRFYEKQGFLFTGPKLRFKL